MPYTLHSIQDTITFTRLKAGFWATLDGNRCKSELDLHRELAAVLRFPDHYGLNFDAMYDCLTDLEWLGADSIWLFITHPSLICSERNNHAEELFKEVLRSTLETYRNHPVHFHLVSEKAYLQFLTH